MNIVFYYKKNKIPKGAAFIDIRTTLLEELNELRKGRSELPAPEPPELWGYYPEKKIAVSILPEELFNELHASRNIGLISQEQQSNYRNLKIAIAGNSVGFNIALTLAMTGGPRFVRLADPDVINLSNLNRMQASILDIGKNKSKILAEKINFLNPFITVEYLNESVTEKNVDYFFSGIDLVIDEVDDIPSKILLRNKAREQKIPLIMATDNGDEVILDVERHDKEIVDFFGGRINDVDLTQLSNLNEVEWLKIANRIIGFSDLTAEMKNTVNKVGKTIYHVPQLGTASTMAGAIVACAVRLMANNIELKTGRYVQKICFD